MRKFWFLSFTFFSIALMIVGCGGGSNSNSSPTPSAAVSATPGVTPDVTPASPVPTATSGEGTIRYVATGSELLSAIATVVSGDIIILRDGTYSSYCKILGKIGTEQNPIIIRAEHRGQALISAQWVIENSAYITVEGLKFIDSNETKILSSNNIRFTRNHFAKSNSGTSLKWLNIYGANNHHNRIDHNLFENKTIKGTVMLLGDGTNIPQYCRIDHNHFRNVGPRVENEMESIRLGTTGSINQSGFAIVEYNLFEQCDGDPEIVSVKNCDNTIRYNTFVGCLGVVSLRAGHRSQVYGNFFFGQNRTAEFAGKPIAAGGVRLYGYDHKVYNNYFSGLAGTSYDAPMQLDGADGDTLNSSNHQKVKRAEVAFNTFVDNVYNIEIASNYNYVPEDCKIANNIVVGATNDLIKEWKTPINMTYQGNIVYPTGSNNVGLTKPQDQLWNINPQLQTVTINGYQIKKLSATSPAINYSQGSYLYVNEDLDGESRSVPDAGADEYSPAIMGNNIPLAASDVGPNAP